MWRFFEAMKTVGGKEKGGDPQQWKTEADITAMVLVGLLCACINGNRSEVGHMLMMADWLIWCFFSFSNSRGEGWGKPTVPRWP